MRFGRRPRNERQDLFDVRDKESKERNSKLSREKKMFLGSLGIDLDQEISNAWVRNIFTLSNSEMVGKRLSYLSHMPRSAWHISKAQGTNYLKEYEEQSKRDLAEFFGILPAGTFIGVAANKGKRLTVDFKETGKQEQLTWEGSPEGHIWFYGDRPDGAEVFIAGERNCQLEITDDCEMILSDDTKQVRLMFTEVSDHINIADEPDYILQVLLPNELERVYIVNDEYRV